jgi:hypothetical protein
MSVAALQYAPDKSAAFAEAARFLHSNARLAFTAFEVDPHRVSDLPVLGTDPVDDYRPLLEAAGFSIERYEETVGWRGRVMGTYGAVLAEADLLGAELGAQAFTALAWEMTTTLERDIYPRRVFAAARKP